MTEQSSLMKQAFLAIQDMQARLDQSERRNHAPVAVIGVGCRFPGGVVDAETFWNLLRDGRDAISTIPSDRWDADAHYDPDPDKPGKMITRRGGFIGRVDGFDAKFFEIAPREAAGMDPQQRVALEVAWEALENAGCAPADLRGSRTGVFLGIASRDYSQLGLQIADPAVLDGHYAMGVSHSIASGRISYLLGLEGPSISIDTACSSSLVAVHLACQSLRTGDSSLALAGGVNLMLIPETTVLLSRLKMLSPEGRCKAFDAEADGFVRGEGCGIVALKLLSQAQADGDRILAVIRGTAVNQDGASSSLTAPNGPSQVNLMLRALKNGAVAAGDVSYVEAHGTGTALGDPIELQALGQVYGAARPVASPLMVASLKTNMGHLEAAAGVAGLIKAVLAIVHKEIPPHLHLQNLTPHVRWNELRLAVPRTLTNWNTNGKPRIAGVSSFGFSGTNAHIVLSEAPAADAARIKQNWPCEILSISARSKAALEQLAASYCNYLSNHPEVDLHDFCFTANTGRSHFAHRACFLAADAQEMQQQLAEFEAPARAALTADSPRVGFLFTGQGSQYGGMGRELYASSPVFREAMEHCAVAWRQETGESLIEVLYPAEGEAGRMDIAKYAQPALFAFEYALAELWRSWGMEPSVVLGHSLGEYVAAVVAGVFSMEDGLRLVCARARLMDTLTAPGAMRAVSASVERVRAAIAGEEKEVGIAVVNGPESVVISGAAEAVNRIAARLQAEGIRSRTLEVTHAFHSPLLEPILDEFEECAGKVKYHAPRVRIISNLTGEAARGEEMATPQYWRRHMRGTVEFHAGLQSALATGCETFIEIGPQPHLISLSKSMHDASNLHWLASARKGRNVWADLLSSVQALYQSGAEIDWRALCRKSGRPIALPTYPFERQRHWFPARMGIATRNQVSVDAQTHPLLGSRVSSPLAEIQYQSRIGPNPPAYLGDHVVRGVRVVPAAAYLEMALSAARAAAGANSALKAIAFPSPCAFDEPRLLQTVLNEDGAATSFAIYSAADASGSDGQDWVLHAAGELSDTDSSLADDEGLRVDVDQIRRRCPDEFDGFAFYRGFEENGANFGANFRTAARIFRGREEALMEFAFSDGVTTDADLYRIHPVMLDACFQAVVALLPMHNASSGVVYLPAALESLRVVGDPRKLALAHAQTRVAIHGDGNTFSADVRGFDSDGNILVAASGLVLRSFPLEEASSRKDSTVSNFYEVEWTVLQSQQNELNFQGTCLLAGDEEMTSRVGSVLEQQGVPWAIAAPHRSRVLGSGHKTALPVAGRAISAIADCIYIAPLAHGREEQALEDCLQAAQELLQMDTQTRPAFWIVTRGAQGPTISNPAHATLWGFGRSLAAEHPEMRVVRIDLDPEQEAYPEDLLRCAQAAGNEDELALRGKDIYVPRLRPFMPGNARAAGAKATEEPNLRLALTKPGTLDGMEIVPAIRQAPAAGEVEIRVAAAGLNFRDVLNALGMYKGKSGPLGGECAGTVVRVGNGVESLRPGDEVVALGQGCFSHFLTTRADLTWRKPVGLSFEAAVTIPIAFLTAWYALKSVADIRPGERVLIHAGAGGVGLAAIQIAQRAGAIVFATAGSPEKRAYLASIGVEHVMDSRALDFADDVRKITNGEGVHVIVNSLVGPAIDAGISILSPGGRFIELGVADLRSADSVAELRSDVAYHAFNLAPALESADRSIREILTAIFEQFASGNLRVLPAETFPLENAREAFRYMAQARHIGRVILCPAKQDGPGIRKDGAYLVTGGFSGIGLEVAGWLAERGAAQVIVMGRNPASAEAAQRFRKMRQHGAIVTECQGDVARQTDVAAALDRAEQFPLRGIFHCAGVFDDGALLDQNPDRFRRVLDPKLEGAKHLDRLSAGLPLDHFVLFSSVASVMGSPGQASYAAANAFLDALAHSRRSQGLVGLSVNWGAWSETGFAARNRTLARGAKVGLRGFSSAEGLRALEILLTSNRAQAMFASIDWDTYFAATGAQSGRGFLNDLRRPRSAAKATAVASGKGASWLPQLENTAGIKRRDLLLQLLEARSQATLGLSTEQSIDPDQPLQELGLDSLLSIELRNALGACLDTKLPATLLFNYPTLNALAGFILRDILHAIATEADDGARSKPTISPKATTLVDDIEALSDEEVDRLLSARETGAAR